MSAATSGQINGTIRKLPVALAAQGRRESIPGFASGEVEFTRASLVVPAGKTRAIITAHASGLVGIDGAAATGVGAYIYIAGQWSQIAHPWADGTDYAIVGTAIREMDVVAGQSIVVRLTCQATSRPVIGTKNWGALAVMGIFSI